MLLHKNDYVHHPQFGQGRVRMVDESTAIVRFESGELQECLLSQLTRLASIEEKGEERHLDPPLEALAHAMAACIRSVNDEWGVFSSSRITLLPHQLWVCRQVQERIPMRWLIADDVGLGKTIEAGLILSSLQASGRLRRVLILAPASLVNQWQERMFNMFDLRFDIYRSENDTKKSGFWHGSRAIIASLETLRSDTKQRWQRLLDAEGWDVVLVDEAHRLNADERRGATLGYELISTLEQHQKIKSMLFFTGTPHRGKDYGFLSLLSLLRSDLFYPRQTLESAFNSLSQIMIRNNKQKVTDMHGNKLFHTVHIYKEYYTYSEKEALFYEQLTNFILSGKAYAQDAQGQKQRVLIFVLMTLQKLASSSIEAVRHALQRRRDLLLASGDETSSAAIPGNLEESLEACEDNAEEQAAAYATTDASYRLPHEITSLQTLMDLAEPIQQETKIRTIIQKIRTDYPKESILFFTEYKATQTLLIKALRQEFGSSCATFINGDECLIFENKTGSKNIETVCRQQAAEDFNKGKVRFLVSTEAAGEGVDLQEHCHVLFHIDLPWNPMRLHQRVGRLHRYGQKHPVHVHVFRNPETVESRIWECLEEKLQRITLAFQGSMEDPEDMCQAVIGMKQPSFYANLFSAAPSANREGLRQWFDSQTVTFGGDDAISVVKRMFGTVHRFDFGTVAANLPQVELHDLCPYLKLTLTRHQRAWKAEGDRMTFKTPKAWTSAIGIADEYRLVFSRELPCKDDEDRGGMGLAPINRAVEEGILLQANYSVLRGLTEPIFILRVQDRSTEKSHARQHIYGVAKTPSGWKIYKDWELLLFLNTFANKSRQLNSSSTAAVHPSQKDFEQAKQCLSNQLEKFHLPFKVPYIEDVACFCIEEKQGSA